MSSEPIELYDVNMSCPYPDCDGEINRKGQLGYCQACHLPVFYCQGCNTENRNFARFCRKCGSKLVFPAPTLREFLKENGHNSFKDPRTIAIDETFWVCPIPYKGMLWALSTKGNIISVSLFSLNPIAFGYLGGGFGKCPFIVREIITDPKETTTVPFLLALSPKRVKGINLLTKDIKEFSSVSASEQLLCSMEHGFVTLEADEQFAYFLKKSGSQISLDVCSLIDGEVRSFPLDEPGVAGPFKIGNRICVYSKNTLHVLESNTLKHLSLPETFTAWTSPGEIRELQPPSCRMPFLVRGDSVYIPGTVGGTPHFLFVSIGASSPTFAPISVKGYGSYAQDGEGQPVIVRDGEIAIYEGVHQKVVKKDGQLVGRLSAYYDNSVTIGFARSAGGYESLRFYHGQSVVDYPLASLHGFRGGTSVGFFCVGGTLAFTYLSEQSYMRAAVWDL